MNTRSIFCFFNATGTCYPDDHYMLPPEDRLMGSQRWMREINDGEGNKK